MQRRVAIGMFLLYAAARAAAGEPLQPAGERTPPARDWAAEARAASQAGHYSSAAEAYSRLLASDPDNPQLLSNLGIMLHLAGRHEEALRPLRKALQRRPEMVSANLFCGLALAALRQPREALPYLERARERDSGPLPLIALGQAHTALWEYREANEFFEQATRRDVRSSEAWLGLALSYGQLAKAVHSHLAGLKADPGQARAAMNAAGNPATRAEMLALETQLDRAPDDLVNLLGLRRACTALAVAAFTRTLEIDPASYEAHLALAEAWEDAQSAARAIPEYEAAIRLRPREPYAYVRLALRHWAAGDSQRALELLKQALALAPEDPPANAYMGDMLVRSGEPEKAKVYIGRALRADARLPMAQIAMAQIHILENHPEQALAEIQQALPADEDGSFYYMLARTLGQLGREVEAQAALEQFRARQALNAERQ